MTKLYVTMLVHIAGLTEDLKRRDERGATAVEYGLLVALIAAVIVTVVATLGGKITGAFEAINSKL